jgi:hypothetical protein
MITLSMAYLLMLVVMNYYSGHFIAIVVGFGSGHYLLNSTSASLDLFDPNKALKTNDDLPTTCRTRNVNYDEI